MSDQAVKEAFKVKMVNASISGETSAGGASRIQAELKRGELVTVLDEYALPAYDIQAVYPQQRYLPAKVRFFIDYLKDIYNSPGYWEVR